MMRMLTPAIVGFVILLIPIASPGQSSNPNAESNAECDEPLPPAAFARLGTARWRQGDVITALQCSDDGKYVASGGRGGHIRLWDAKTGRHLRLLDSFGTPIIKIAFAPDNRFVVAAAGDRTFGVWNVESGKQVFQDAMGNSPAPIAVAPGGATVACENAQGQILIKKYVNGKITTDVLSLPAQNRTLALHFSKDGKQLTAVFLDGAIRHYDIAKKVILRQERESLITNGTYPLSAMFAPPSKTLVTLLNSRLLRISDSQSHRTVNDAKELKFDLRGVALSSDGKTVAAIGESPSPADNCIWLWDVKTDKLIRHFGAGSVGGTTVCFSPDGKTLFAGHYDGAIRVWDVPTGKQRPRQSSGHGDKVIAISWSPDSQLLVSASADKTIRLWKARDGEQIHKIHCETTVFDVAFARDGKSFASAGADGQVRFWNTATGEVERTVGSPEKKAILEIAFSPKGNYLAARCDDQTVVVWNAKTGKQIWSAAGIKNQQAPNQQITNHQHQAIQITRGLEFSPDGRFLATNGLRLAPTNPAQGLGNYWVHLYDAANGKVRRVLQVPWQPMTLAFAPDSRSLAVGDASSAALLLELSTGQTRGSLKSRFSTRAGFNFGNPHFGIGGFSSPGRQFGGGCVGFAAGHGHGFSYPGYGFGYRGHQFNPYQQSLPLIQEFLGHTKPISALAFSPRGHHIVTGGQDNRIVLWNSLSAKAILEVGDQRGAIRCVSFAPDGKSFASGGDDTSIVVWDFKKTLSRQKDAIHAQNRQAWDSLAMSDAPSAFRALQQLAEHPEQAVSLVEKHIKPVTLSAQQIQKWLDDLGSARFRVREKATKELKRIAIIIEPALREAYARNNTLEVQMRLDRLLEKLNNVNPTPARLQQMRALELLERLGTPHSRKILEALAHGTPQAWLTQQARAALDRQPE